MRLALLALAVAACNTPPEVAPSIDTVTPDHGPLLGGTRIVLAGHGIGDPAEVTRVFVGGREAPLANPLGDGMIEVIIPFGDAAGPAELIAISGTTSAIAADRFRYSTEPTVTSVSPAEVVYQNPTTLTVRGSGFLDEGAGDVTVLVDGERAENLEVVSDSELRITVTPARALGRSMIEVSNLRGLGAKERAFRYRPAATSGLLLFLRGGQFAIFYDPVTATRVDIARVSPQQPRITSVARDSHGDYRLIYDFTSLGRLDLGTQLIDESVPVNVRVPAMVHVGGTLYGITRESRVLTRFGLDGSVDPFGQFTFPCCGSWGLAHDGTTLWVTARSGVDRTIASLDVTTGVPGTPVKLVGALGLHVEELRAFGGALYATSRDGTLLRIDPATGAAAVVANMPRAQAMEVFD